MRPFDLVILDLDGTILHPTQATGLSAAVRSVVNELQQVGIPVSIGTGRTLDLMRNYAEELNITVPVITTQGAVIADPVSNQILSETLMPLDVARQVATWVDDARHTTVFYFTGPDGHVTIYQNQIEDAAESDFYDHVLGKPRLHQPAFQGLLREEDAHSPVKFITINPIATASDMTPELTALFPTLTITRTHTHLVEGTAKGINKGAGVRKLCRFLNIDPARVLAIGDNDNDIPMLEAVGFGIAMGNGSPGAKAVADWVAPSIADDGAAEALRHWVLDRYTA